MKLKSLLVIATIVQFSDAFLGLHRNGFYHRRNKYLEEPEPSEYGTRIETKWIEQRLDNFNNQNIKTWYMRYMENKEFLVNDGPMFIYITGEASIDDSKDMLTTGQMYNMAKKVNGTLIAVEHRYYGESRPTSDMSTENLAYLSVDQALSDLAHFIIEKKRKNIWLRNSGIILVGGSYGGTMATWFMQKYPHLANGSWASSAPLKAQVDFSEYFEVVSESIMDIGSKSCVDRIQKAFEEINLLVQSQNISRLKQVFNLCEPINLTNNLNVWTFFEYLVAPFAEIVQYHRDNNIQEECNRLVNSKEKDDVVALAYWLYSEGDSPTLCRDTSYNSMIEHYKKTEFHSSEAGRQWLYQICSEFGWFQSASSEKTLFGSVFPVDLNLQLCRDVFGKR